MSIHIRRMIESDILAIHQNFIEQGWKKDVDILKHYFNEQELYERKVFVAHDKERIFGYATLLPNAPYGPYKNMNMPMIIDLNVFLNCQKQGIATMIMDAIELHVQTYAKHIGLACGMHKAYGSAQRLYVKRGYIPDGTGLWYQDKPVEPYTPCINDDDLVIYLSKKL